MAAAWLAKRDCNRDIDRMKIIPWIADPVGCMAGSTITVGKDGRLIDGQHRLTAIVESGVSVHLNVSIQ
jgi:hypothetical protein